MNYSLTLPTQFPDEEIEGRSSCTRSPSSASLGTGDLTLRARPLGIAPCHLLEHPSGKEKHQMQENLGSQKQVPEVPKERGPRPGDLRGMMPCRLWAWAVLGLGSPWADRSAPDSAPTATQAVGPSAVPFPVSGAGATRQGGWDSGPLASYSCLIWVGLCAPKICMLIP